MLAGVPFVVFHGGAMMKRFLLLLVTVLLMAAAPVCAAFAQDVFTLQTSNGSVPLHTQTIEEEVWLFLPAFAQLDQLSVEGAQLEWWDTEPDEDGLWYVDVICGEDVTEVYVMRSENLPALFLFSDDPVNEGIGYIEGDISHEAFTTATLAMVNVDGTLRHAETIANLRGRGNWTWNWPKKAYQIKLENRVDLLNTGDSANRARTWVLLAEGLDSTLLHNRITSDLAKELGLSAMDSEFVDLYYDGAYRGTYLLSEKVEVGEGRIDVLDYENLLKKWNNKVGQRDLDILPEGEAVNRYGNTYTYVEGVVEDSRPDVGAYFVEMESRTLTLSDPCWFTLNGADDPVYALKNPENATQKMVAYISERLQQAQDTLKAGGVNPETGRTIYDDFNVDAFARTMLLQELAYNVDGYTYSSSYFVLPEGETQFQPGPMWDFDLSYRYYWDGRNAGAAGFKDTQGWVTDFYAAPDFMECAQNIYLNELYPLLQNVLLGDQSGQYVQPLTAYQDWLAASAAMNEKVWGIIREGRFDYGDSYDAEIRMLRRFITQRSEWLMNVMNDLQPRDENSLALWMDVSFTNPDDSLRFHTAPWQGITAQAVSAEQLTEATEEDYALWQMEAVIASVDGKTLEGCSVTLNGTPVTARPQEDGTLLIRAVYEDQSYRPVDYYGDDVGLIYDYEKYIAAYPEVVEICEYDEEAVLDYFFDEGIYEAHVGNGLFDPKEVVKLQPYVADSLYDEWMNYYWEFLSWGYDSGWLQDTSARFVPSIADVP